MIPRLRRAFPAILALVVAAGLAACDQVPLLAPSEATLTLSTNRTTLAPGETAEITATVVESSGTAVHNGTLVVFSTTAGRLEPQEARTHNGVARATLSWDGNSGVAVVNATSGGATTRGTTGGGDGGSTPSGALEIRLGAAAAGAVSVTAEPATVPATGGTVTIRATVTDANSRRLAGVAVDFSARAGVPGARAAFVRSGATVGVSLSANTAFTDSNGVATVSLTTSVDTVVTARVAPEVEGVVAITARELTGLNVSLSQTTDTPKVGDTVELTVAAIGEGGVRNVRVSFGDGTSTTIGTVQGGSGQGVSVRHVFTSSGTFTVTATGTDLNGDTVSGSVPVVVSPRPPLIVELTVPTGEIEDRVAVAFSVTVTDVDGTVAVQSVTWNWGDGTSTTVNGLTTTHVYLQEGVYTIRVTVHAADGRAGSSSAQVKVDDNNVP